MSSIASLPWRRASTAVLQIEVAGLAGDSLRTTSRYTSPILPQIVSQRRHTFIAPSIRRHDGYATRDDEGDRKHPQHIELTLPLFRCC